MRAISGFGVIPGFNRRLVAASLLALAAVPPAAAGSVEPARQVVTPVAVQVADKSAVQTEVSAKASGTVSRRVVQKRDPRLNEDLAAFSRAF